MWCSADVRKIVSICHEQLSKKALFRRPFRVLQSCFPTTTRGYEGIDTITVLHFLRYCNIPYRTMVALLCPPRPHPFYPRPLLCSKF